MCWYLQVRFILINLYDQLLVLILIIWLVTSSLTHPLQQTLGQKVIINDELSQNIPVGFPYTNDHMIEFCGYKLMTDIEYLYG